MPKTKYKPTAAEPTLNLKVTSALKTELKDNAYITTFETSTPRAISIPLTLLDDAEALGAATMQYHEVLDSIDKFTNPPKQKITEKIAETLYAHCKPLLDITQNMLHKTHGNIQNIEMLLETLQVIQATLSPLAETPLNLSGVKALSTMTISIGDAYRLKGDQNNALKYYKKSLNYLAQTKSSDLMPIFSKLCNSLIECDTKLPGDIAVSLNAIARTYPKDQTELGKALSKQLHTNMALIEAIQGERGNAQAYYQQAFKKTDSANVLNKMAEIYYKQGNHKDALGYFTAAAQHSLGLEKSTISTYTELAHIYFENKFYGMSAALGEKAMVQKESVLGELYNILCESYAYLGYHKKAASFVTDAIISIAIALDIYDKDNTTLENIPNSCAILLETYTGDRNELYKQLHAIVEHYFYLAEISYLNIESRTLVTQYHTFALSIKKTIISDKIEQAAAPLYEEEDHLSIKDKTAALLKKHFRVIKNPQIEEFIQADLNFEEQLQIIKYFTSVECIHEKNPLRIHRTFKALKEKAVNHVKEQKLNIQEDATPHQELCIRALSYSAQDEYTSAKKCYDALLLMPNISNALLTKWHTTKIYDMMQSKTLINHKAILAAIEATRSPLPHNNHFTALLYEYLARAYLNENNTKDAMTSIITAIDILHAESPTITPISLIASLRIQADILAQEKQCHKALNILYMLQNLSHKIDEYSKSDKAYDYLKIHDVCRQLELFHEAETNLTEFISITETIDPQNPANQKALAEHYHNLVTGYLSTNRHAEALPYVQKAKTWYLANKEGHKMKLCSILRIEGEIYFQQKQYAEAIECFNNYFTEIDGVEQTNHILFAIHYIAAISHCALKNLDEASRMCEKARIYADTHQEWHAFYNQMSFISREKSEHEKAITYIQEYLNYLKRTDSNSPEIHVQYTNIGKLYQILAAKSEAELCAELGNKALEAFDEAIKHCNDSEKRSSIYDNKLEVITMTLISISTSTIGGAAAKAMNKATFVNSIVTSYLKHTEGNEKFAEDIVSFIENHGVPSMKQDNPLTHKEKAEFYMQYVKFYTYTHNYSKARDYCAIIDRLPQHEPAQTEQAFDPMQHDVDSLGDADV